jgi:hypothetical protein
MICRITRGVPANRSSFVGWLTPGLKMTSGSRRWEKPEAMLSARVVRRQA